MADRRKSSVQIRSTIFDRIQVYIGLAVISFFGATLADAGLFEVSNNILLLFVDLFSNIGITIVIWLLVAVLSEIYLVE